MHSSVCAAASVFIGAVVRDTPRPYPLYHKKRRVWRLAPGGSTGSNP